MNKKLLVSVLLCFFVFSLGMIAQEEEKMITKQERKRMKIQAAMAEPEDIIFVDDATGNDKKGEGTEKKPYKTIGRALEVAESGDTIKVRPGVYSESFWIKTLARITIEGSGSHSTTIDGHVWADWCEELIIDGFTIKGDPDRKVGIWCWNVATAYVSNCIIDCPYYGAVGIWVELGTSMWVNDSQIGNTGEEGYGVAAELSSFMHLHTCTIEGNGIGVSSAGNSYTEIVNCEVKHNNPYYWGIEAWENSEVNIRGCSIHDNPCGVFVGNGGIVNLNGSSYQGPENHIFSNTGAGIHLDAGGQLRMSRRTNLIESNPIGIQVTKGSILRLGGGEHIITGNDLGIEVREFAHAFLENNSINGNTLDVYIHMGGQAICNPENIGKIRSDCPYCQHEPTGSQRP
jgi:nitrous oxidase accessory protein NosD